MNNLKITLLSMALFGALAAQASLTVYDGFDYSGATDVDGETGGTGWSGAWSISGGSPTVTSGYNGSSLSNSAFTGAGFSPIGGAMTNDHDTFAAQRDFASAIDLTTDGAMYFSFLISMSETSTFDDITFIGSDSPPFEVRLSDTLAATGGSGTFEQTGSILSANTTYFVVGKVTTSATGNDFMSAAVFEDGDTVPGAEAFDITSSGSAVGGSLTGIQFYQGDTANNDGDPTTYDEFRMGTTWDSVAIPEPSTFMLVGLSLVAGFVGLRRRRR